MPSITGIAYPSTPDRKGWTPARGEPRHHRPRRRRAGRVSGANPRPTPVGGIIIGYQDFPIEREVAWLSGCSLSAGSSNPRLLPSRTVTRTPNLALLAVTQLSPINSPVVWRWPVPARFPILSRGGNITWLNLWNRVPTLSSGIPMPVSRTEKRSRQLDSFLPRARPDYHFAFSVNLIALAVRL